MGVSFSFENVAERDGKFGICPKYGRSVRIRQKRWIVIIRVKWKQKILEESEEMFAQRMTAETCKLSGFISVYLVSSIFTRSESYSNTGLSLDAVSLIEINTEISRARRFSRLTVLYL